MVDLILSIYNEFYVCHKRELRAKEEDTIASNGLEHRTFSITFLAKNISLMLLSFRKNDCCSAHVVVGEFKLYDPFCTAV
jgi:hypothetical protein